ncbi:CrcB protein [Micrococcales bacterium KH10]|nr:CrcB protein [Micrococcales bacterium KH10]
MMVLIGLGGAFGAVLRYLVDAGVKKRTQHLSVPVGLIVVNVSACLLMGVVYGWLAGREHEAVWLSVLGTGFLGGYSTFGSAMLESFQLLRGGRPVAALIHSTGMLAASWGALMVGLAVSLVL